MSEPLAPLIDAEAVAEGAAEIFVAMAHAAVAQRERFTVVLAGGSTPRRLYALLASPAYVDQVPWEHTHVFFGDERCVPADHEDSNYRMARETLLERVPIPRDQIHPMSGHLTNPSRAAFFYEQELRATFGDGVHPRFDLLLLGMGDDGHTASLFPGTDGLKEVGRWVIANWVPKLDAWRLTLTYTALVGAEMTLFLITGKAKARVVAEAFGGWPHDPPHPCEGVVPVDGVREILLDREAGSLLGTEPPEQDTPQS